MLVAGHHVIHSAPHVVFDEKVGIRGELAPRSDLGGEFPSEGPLRDGSRHEDREPIAQEDRPEPSSGTNVEGWSLPPTESDESECLRVPALFSDRGAFSEAVRA